VGQFWTLIPPLQAGHYCNQSVSKKFGGQFRTDYSYYCLPIGTIRIMAEIDQFIDEHGDWPIK
jgi:hypothetical protein